MEKEGYEKVYPLVWLEGIDANDFANIAYDIYLKSLKSYGFNNSKIPSMEQYNQIILKQSKYDGFDLWRAFVEEQLAAFSTCIIIEGAVSLGSTKSNPEYYKYYPNNGLFYSINWHYLREKKVLYITNGYFVTSYFNK